MPHANSAGYNAPSPLLPYMKNPFRSHPSSTPMIVQAHDPAGTRRARIALVAGWLLSLAATWLIASYLAAPGLFDMRQRLTQAESERDRSRDELEQARAIEGWDEQVVAEHMRLLAEHVRADLLERVIAHRDGNEVDAGELGVVRRESGDGVTRTDGIVELVG